MKKLENFIGISKAELQKIKGGDDDEKSNQLFNILSTVLKSIKEMSSSTTRNLS